MDSIKKVDHSGFCLGQAIILSKLLSCYCNLMDLCATKFSRQTEFLSYKTVGLFFN